MSDGIPTADRRLLQRMEDAFTALAGGDAVIDAAELKKALGLRSEYLSRRVLSLLDTDGDGVVRRDEFIAGVRGLVFGSADQKLAFAFRLHDHDGDGMISRDEMRRMVAIGLAEDDARTTPEQVDRLVTALFAHADVDRNQELSFKELSTAVQGRPALLAQLTRSEARWLAPNIDLLDRVLAPRRPLPSRIARALDNRRPEAVFVAVWAAANVAFMAGGALSVYGHGTPRSEVFWMLSSACTSGIKFNAALIVLPVLRRLLTWMRGTSVSRVVPIDGAVDFHRAVGNTLYALTVGHAFAVIADDVAQGEFFARITSLRALSGLAWFVVFTFLWSFSRTAVRRSEHFELFYFSHMAYLAWFALALVHAPTVLACAAVGLVGLGIETALRRLRRGVRARVRSIEPLRSGVTRLEFERPPGFNFRAGDWMFVCLPRLSRHEWHPFTISSAPERGTLTVHVRTLGNWSGALRRRVEDPSATRDPAMWEAYLDGPYGSPTGNIFATGVPVLIGAGIGVTPFASVLESLVLRSRAGSAPVAVQKAYFYWLNRDLYAFEWFRQLLQDLERQDTRHLLEVHVWLTGGHAGASAMGLELARELVRESGGHDVVSGLRAKMHMEHPDWESELRSIQRAHAPAIPEVFFCGPAGLGRKVHAVCERLAIPFREERF